MKNKVSKIKKTIQEAEKVQNQAKQYFKDSIAWEGPIETDQKDKLIFIISQELPKVDHLDLFNASEQQLMRLLQKIREKKHGI
jgi:hypothetical protein